MSPALTLLTRVPALEVSKASKTKTPRASNATPARSMRCAAVNGGRGCGTGLLALLRGFTAFRAGLLLAAEVDGLRAREGDFLACWAALGAGRLVRLLLVDFFGEVDRLAIAVPF
jgi:hypothetical protein